MSSGCVALLIPPGWTLATGGPHLGTALLAGALLKQSIPVHLADWNLEMARSFGATLTERDAQSACADPNLDSLNYPYFRAQEALNTALGSSSATWDIQQGYSDLRFDRKSPEAIQKALSEPSSLDHPLEALAQRLLEDYDPTLIGISITVPGQLLPAFYAVKALRSVGFDRPIILGGNLVTRLGALMALPWVFDLIDGIALWQGEISIPRIWSERHNREWNNIPNLIWRDRDQIRLNDTCQLAPSTFSLPDFRGLPLKHYWGSRFLTAIGSRGCYYGKCSFCSIPYGWGKGGFLGNDTAENVIRQIESGVSNFGIHRFKFVEEAMHPGLISSVADRLIQEELNIEFEGYARFDRPWMEPGLLARLSRSGLKKLYLGMELARTEARSVLNKADALSFVDLLAALQDHGIKAHLFCMFGYPGTGVDDAIETINFALRHQEIIDSLDIFPFYYATHTIVPGISALNEPNAEWTVEQKYEPTVPGVMTMDEVSLLVQELEDYVWKVNPRWLHPVYRMVSPWTTAEQLRSANFGEIDSYVAAVSR